MLDRSPRLVARRQLLVIVGLAAVGLLSLSFGRTLLARYELGQRAAAIRQEIDDLQTDHVRLQQELAYWESDEGLEQLAREELGWARPGEGAALVAGAAAPPPEKLSATHPRSSAPNWRRWLELFFGT